MTDDHAGIPHRVFLAVATTPDSIADVEIFTTWLCDERLGSRRFSHVHPELARNPTIRQVDVAVSSLAGLPNDGAAVVYVGGDGTAIDVAALIGGLRSCRADDLMVVLDLRFTTPTAYDTLRLPALRPTWIVMAGPGPHDDATPSALTAAIRGFLTELDSRAGERFDHGPYLRRDQFWEFLAKREQRLRLFDTGAPSYGFSRCLPNPRHVAGPELLAPARRDLAIRPEDLLAHWEPKARGSDAGWMFSGRTAVMRELVAFLRGQASALVVTGAAGTGKSAVLGQLVISTDRRFREEHPELVGAFPADLQPDAGAIDVAVLATGKSAEELFEQVLEALGVVVEDEPRPTLATLTELWHSWISTQADPVTVVVDALDEANNPRALFDDVLLTIARTPAPGSVRLIVGVRGPSSDPMPAGDGGKAFAEDVVDRLGARHLPVDEEPYLRDTDLVEFASEILRRTPGSPYATDDHRDLADRIAVAIAERARPSFLVTRLAANNLVNASAIIDPDDASWHRSLDEGLVGIFRDDLCSARPDPAHRRQAVHLLRAVAFAKGRGLPWSEVWPLVANAIADPPSHYDDSDVAELLDSRLSGYLVTDHENGFTVYRLFHDALRTTLRERWAELMGPAS